MNAATKIGIIIAVIVVVIILLMVVMKSGNTTTTVNNGSGGSNNSNEDNATSEDVPAVDVLVPPAIKGVRYVQIETPSNIKDGVGTNTLNLAELYVYNDKGAVVSKNKSVATNTVSYSSLFRPSNLVDGNETSVMHSNWKTSSGEAVPFITATVDLGAETNVTRVKVINRVIFQSRFNNSNIKLLSSSGAILFTHNTGTNTSKVYDIITA
jgi:hypothetical protein